MQQSKWVDLPTAILYLVLSFLSAKSLANVTTTNRDLSLLAPSCYVDCQEFSVSSDCSKRRLHKKSLDKLREILSLTRTLKTLRIQYGFSLRAGILSAVSISQSLKVLDICAQPHGIKDLSRALTRRNVTLDSCSLRCTASPGVYVFLRCLRIKSDKLALDLPVTMRNPQHPPLVKYLTSPETRNHHVQYLSMSASGLSMGVVNLITSKFAAVNQLTFITFPHSYWQNDPAVVPNFQSLHTKLPILVLYRMSLNTLLKLRVMDLHSLNIGCILIPDKFASFIHTQASSETQIQIFDTKSHTFTWREIESKRQEKERAKSYHCRVCNKTFRSAAGIQTHFENKNHVKRINKQKRYARSKKRRRK